MPIAGTRPAVVALGTLVALALAGCPSTPSAPPAPVVERSNLKVTLPDGWKATPAPGGLQAGPGARVVLELESSSRPLPTGAALVASVQEQGGVVQQKEDVGDFVGVLYLLGGADAGAPSGFLGARQAGKKTVWCATTAGASAAEVAQAWEVCARVRWAGADGGD